MNIYINLMDKKLKIALFYLLVFFHLLGVLFEKIIYKIDIVIIICLKKNDTILQYLHN